MSKEVVRLTGGMLEALALWLCLNGFSDSDKLVKRDDLVLGLHELGIIRGDKRHLLRTVSKTTIGNFFQAKYAAQKTIIILVVCPINEQWHESVKVWIDKNKAELLSKGAIKTA